jgi:hypothetical protein
MVKTYHHGLRSSLPFVTVKPPQIRDERQQPVHAGGERARAENEILSSGDGLRVGTDSDRTF